MHRLRIIAKHIHPGSPLSPSSTPNNHNSNTDHNPSSQLQSSQTRSIIHSPAANTNTHDSNSNSNSNNNDSYVIPSDHHDVHTQRRVKLLIDHHVLPQFKRLFSSSHRSPQSHHQSHHQSSHHQSPHDPSLIQQLIQLTCESIQRNNNKNNNNKNHHTFRVKQQHNFNMIEILIAISIIVTFSGLTGTVFAQKYEETRVSNAQLDLARIQEGLVMYYTRKAVYPLDLEELLENGDLNKVPKDPWGTDYLYVPHLDWSRFVRLLGSSSSGSSTSSGSTSSATGGQQKKKSSSGGGGVMLSSNMIYFREALKRMRNCLLNLPESIEKIQVLAMAMDQPFCICVGTKLPRFPPKIDTNVSREKIKYVAQLMKMARERSEGELNELVTEVLNIAKE